VIIDFNRCGYGDPWFDFNCIEWDAALSPHFATGQLRGYFGGEPPVDFFTMLAFYIACNQLTYVYGAANGLNNYGTMMSQTKDVLAWFDNMNNPVPAWYLK
jgi:serine/threonine-protein kinase